MLAFILASSSSNGYAVYGLLYVGGLAFGLWLRTKAPKRANMSSKADSARFGILYAALIPCAGIQVIVALYFFAQYKIAVRGLMSDQELSEKFKSQSFGTTPTAAPPPSTNNPFGAATPSAAPPPVNPFGAAPPSAAPPSQPGPSPDNPFL